MPDSYCFSEENILVQLQSAPFTLGFYTLRFYTELGRPVNRITPTIDEFYLYPSGGTFRDCTYNIVTYDSRFDTYRGFIPPHLQRVADKTQFPPESKLAPHLLENIPLSPYTTIGLGGNARYFSTCTSTEQLREGLRTAKERNLPIFILGGGSNVIIADAGCDGVVLHVATHGVTRKVTGGTVEVSVESGEPWDEVVRQCVELGDAGLECLSGIPGSTGATPLQNVGAYGQAVSQTITRVDAIDTATLQDVQFSPAECLFGYRTSRFKHHDAGKFVITAVTFQLQHGGMPSIAYPELRKHLAETVNLDALVPGAPALSAVRNAVLALRRKKSMVADPSDPNARSVGSFFTNPIIPQEFFVELRAKWPEIPGFPVGGGVKIPAAWLVECAGFHKGYRMGGAAVSDHHALALVNRGTTSTEILSLAKRIEDEVHSRFGVTLEREPVIL